jgi:hypothetical protein
MVLAFHYRVVPRSVAEIISIGFLTYPTAPTSTTRPTPLPQNSIVMLPYIHCPFHFLTWFPLGSPITVFLMYNLWLIQMHAYVTGLEASLVQLMIQGDYLHYNSYILLHYSGNRVCFVLVHFVNHG